MDIIEENRNSWNKNTQVLQELARYDSQKRKTGVAFTPPPPYARNLMQPIGLIVAFSYKLFAPN